jgi:hypothetical protein
VPVHALEVLRYEAITESTFTGQGTRIKRVYSCTLIRLLHRNTRFHVYSSSYEFDEEGEIGISDEHPENTEGSIVEARQPFSNVTIESSVQLEKQPSEIVSIDEGIQIN